MTNEPANLPRKGPEADETAPPKFPTAPYRGIDHFRFVDHPIFFARQRETLDLLRCVMSFKGVILFGGSGSGKSSLINAGLLTQIIEMGFVPDRVRVQDKLEREIVIERISRFDDEDSPFLAPSLADGLSSNGKNRVVVSLKQFEERLRAHAEDVRPLIILDQFEEMITLFEETEQSHQAINESLIRQKQIFDLLVGFLHDESLPVKILFAFREDYLAKFTKFFRWAPELPNQYLRVTPPQTTALKDIIAGPLSKDLLPHYDRQQTFSDELINRLIEEFTGRSEGGSIDLSQVQIVCSELWQADDPTELLESKKIAGLLQHYFKKELNALSPEQQHLATGLLSHMLTFTNTRNFISGVELIRLFRIEEPASEESLKGVLKALTKTQLVKRELRHGNYYYEIASEFLVPWIIKRKSERQADLERRRIEEETQREREEERTMARQRLRITRLVLALTGLVMVLALVLAYVMTRQKQKEEVLKREAVTKREETEKIIRILSRLFKSPPAEIVISNDQLKAIKSKLGQDRLGGVQQISSLIKNNQFPPELVPSLVDPLTSTGTELEVAQAARALLAQATEAKDKANAEKKKIAKDKLEAIQEMGELMGQNKFPRDLVLSLLNPTLTAKESDPDVTRAVSDLIDKASKDNAEVAELIANPNVANILPARVYIQIESEQQSTKARSIQAELEKSNYVVPGFEVVGVRAPRSYELRFYRQADEERSKEIVALLKRNLNLDVKPVYLKGQENNEKIRPGHFELWMATQSKPGEDFYLIVNYSASTEERQMEIVQLITRITGQEGGDVEPESGWGHYLKVGPYDHEQARKVRNLLIEQDSRLRRRIDIIRR